MTGFMKNRLAVIYGDRPIEMTKQLLQDVQLEAQIAKGAKIGLKPNLVVAKPAETGATTHVEIAQAVIEYLKDHGHSNICILEGSWVGDSTKRAFKTCGWEALSRQYNIPLIDTKDDRKVIKESGGLKMEICASALEIDFLINLPVLKGHCQTTVTGALKNMKGLITDSEKRRFHTLGLHRPIAHVNKVLHQDFIIVDGICGDLDFEEGGNPVQMNRIFCGTDPVLTDSYIASCMGYDPRDIEYIRLAGELGVGTCGLANAQIDELNKDTQKTRPSPSRKVQKLAGYVNEQDACSACYANLIQALARLDDDGLLRRLPEKSICIGQGFQGKADGKIGIGRCAGGCTRSLAAGCPPKTPEILAFLRETL